jgi:hypothetical protein
MEAVLDIISNCAISAPARQWTPQVLAERAAPFWAQVAGRAACDDVPVAPQRVIIRWVLPCIEGTELLHVPTATASLTIVLRLESVYQLIFALLGPLYEKIDHLCGCKCGTRAEQRSIFELDRYAITYEEVFTHFVLCQDVPFLLTEMRWRMRIR